MNAQHCPKASPRRTFHRLHASWAQIKWACRTSELLSGAVWWMREKHTHSPQLQRYGAPHVQPDGGFPWKRWSLWLVLRHGTSFWVHVQTTVSTPRNTAVEKGFADFLKTLYNLKYCHEIFVKKCFLFSKGVAALDTNKYEWDFCLLFPRKPNKTNSFNMSLLNT